MLRIVCLFVTSAFLLSALPAAAQTVGDDVPVPATALLVAPAAPVPVAPVPVAPVPVAAATVSTAPVLSARDAARLAAAVLMNAANEMPTAPRGVAASYVTPPRDAAGQYVTPNRGLSADESVWHLRVALNVAALGCRDADEVATVAAYNALLAAAKPQLAAAQAGVTQRYKARFGAAHQTRNDDAMTRLYNFFAQPTGHAGFCTAAKAVLVESAAVQPVALAGYAATALPRLEAPFLAFFADYDGYRTRLASWRARQPAGARVTFAAAATPGVGTVAP